MYHQGLIICLTLFLHAVPGGIYLYKLVKYGTSVLMQQNGHIRIVLFKNTILLHSPQQTGKKHKNKDVVTHLTYIIN